MSNNIKQGSLDQITATSLIEDLKNSETKIKINAIHNLREISFLLSLKALNLKKSVPPAPATGYPP